MFYRVGVNLSKGWKWMLLVGTMDLSGLVGVLKRCGWQIYKGNENISTVIRIYQPSIEYIDLHIVIATVLSLYQPYFQDIDRSTMNDKFRGARLSVYIHQKTRPQAGTGPSTTPHTPPTSHGSQTRWRNKDKAPPYWKESSHALRFHRLEACP